MDRALILKAEKWLIWVALIAIVFLLRHLFPIFFLTFVLSYIGNTAVKALGNRIPNRKVRVVIVYAALLGVLSGVALLVIPRMVQEARNLARLYITTEAARPDAPETAEPVGVIEREALKMIDALIVGVAGRETFLEFRESEAYALIVTRLHNGLTNATPRVVRALTIFANNAFILTTHFIISIILSFLMLWNLPETQQRMKRFAYGRTAEIYAEIAPSLRAFGIMLGRAFEAQTVVAIVNASLSSIAFVALGLPSIALLATVVFFCSYIPILGMILSTIPAALLALKIGGVTHVLWVIVAILIIHAIEAYLLNPLIYGRHLRLHPLAVLVILLVGENLFGVWGLLLGVPIAAFIFRYAIEGEDVERPKPAPVPAAAPERSEA